MGHTDSPLMRPEPIRYLVGEFILTKTDMEFVNGLCGVLLCLALIAPGNVLLASPALIGMLALIPSEIIWSVIFGSWGGATFLAWLCSSIRCRQWAMFASMFIWGLLFWQAVISPAAFGFVAGTTLALGCGTTVAYVRMSTTWRSLRP